MNESQGKNIEVVGFILFGSIGDFLMARSAAAEIQSASPKTKVVLYTTRNAALLRPLAGDIEVVELSFSVKRIHRVIAELLSLRKHRSILVLPPAFGNYSRAVRLFTRMVAGGRNARVASFFIPGRTTPMPGALEFNMSSSIYSNFAAALAPDYALASRPSFPRPNTASADKPYIYVQPFAASPGRTMPARSWKTVLNGIRERLPQHQILVGGAPSDMTAAGELCEGIDYCEVVAGETLAKTAERIAVAACYVGVDTGTSHLASMMEVPSVLAMNASNPCWSPEYGSNTTALIERERCACRGDKTGDCSVLDGGVKYFRCVYDIRPQDVVEVVASFLLKPETRLNGVVSS